MKDRLLELKRQALEELERATDAAALEAFRVAYLGKRAC